jgi:hypothetical protein
MGIPVTAGFPILIQSEINEKQIFVAPFYNHSDCHLQL